MAKLDHLILQIRNELGSSFISTDIVGLDGLSIAGNAADSHVNRDEATARAAMIMKLASNISKKLGFGEVDDTLVTTDKYYLLIRFLGDGSYIWGLVVSRDAILGSVRLLMNEFSSQLMEAIPH